MACPGNIIVIGDNPGPIGQDAQKIAFRLVVHAEECE
jgi:hypothetical protein